LAGTGKQLFLKQAHTSFLYHIAAFFGSNSETLISDFKVKGNISRAALANRVQKLVAQPDLTCPLPWRALVERDDVAGFAFICLLKF